MFFAFHHQPPQVPDCRGPFQSFADAIDPMAPLLVVEFSLVYGWLAIWEHCDDRFELVAEAPIARVLRTGIQRIGQPQSSIARRTSHAADSMGGRRADQRSPRGDALEGGAS